MKIENTNLAIIIMGVCGVGKTSIGKALAERLNATYIEADEFHSEQNLVHMSQGIPLSDDMRLPWLIGLGDAAEAARETSSVVVACSALKRSYRDLLRLHIRRTQFVLLDGDRDVIAKRLAQRTDHFMSASLLDSQIATLEKPTDDETPITVDILGTKIQVVDRIEQALRRASIEDKKRNLQNIENRENINVN